MVWRPASTSLKSPHCRATFISALHSTMAREKSAVSSAMEIEVTSPWYEAVCGFKRVKGGHKSLLPMRMQMMHSLIASAEPSHDQA